MTSSLIPIFILIGRRGAGKDSSVASLQDVHKLSFAHELKNYASQTYNLPINLFHDQKLKDQPLDILIPDSARQKFSSFCKPDQTHWTPRDLCLLEGAVKRAVIPAYWINYIFKEIQNLKHPVIVTDCRFDDEYSALIAIPGRRCVAIKIVRDDIEDKGPSSEADQLAEQFAIQFDKHDYLIENNNTISDLQSRMKTVIMNEI